jgi:hypothetical protein
LDGVLEYGWEIVKKFYVVVVKILENKKCLKNAGKKKCIANNLWLSPEVQIVWPRVINE